MTVNVLIKTNVSYLEFSDEERLRAEEAWRTAPSPYEDLTAARAFATAEGVPMVPASLRIALREFNEFHCTPGAIVIRNTPVDAGRHRGPAPKLGGVPEQKSAYIDETLALTLAESLNGVPFGTMAEKDGEIVQNVVNIGALKDTQSNASSTTPLQFHNEGNNYGEQRADFVILNAIDIPAEAPATVLASARKAIVLLPDEDIAALRKSSFRFGASQSQSHTENTWSDWLPVIDGPASAPEIRVEFLGETMMHCGGEAADKALNRLKRAINRVAVKVPLSSGDLLIIKNKAIVHGREAFSGQETRWLQRVLVKSGSTWNGRGQFVDQYRL